MNTVARIMILAVAAGLAVYAAIGVAKNRSLSSHFASLRKGATIAEVRSTMGAPTSERAQCRDPPSWLGEPVVETHCEVEYQYDAFLLPKFWTVAFDPQGRVFAKYEYVSP